MAERRRKYRTVYIVTAALMAAMIGGYALAATTVTTLTPGQSSNITNTPTPGGFANIGAITSEQLVVLTAGMTGATRAGTETVAAVGLNGTTAAIAACATAPCVVQNFRTAVPATEATGDFGEQIGINVLQPAVSGASLGFDFSITISVTVTGVTSSLVVQGYLATGAAGAAQKTVPVFLFVDLGTITSPVINSLSVVFNQCSNATYCP
ncbi:MAG: hypothetical protein ACLPWO_01675 [Thermoplasmata archaeon]